MAGQGHQFPGNFQGNAGSMRTGFGGGPMGSQMQSMPNQLTGECSSCRFMLLANSLLLCLYYEGDFGLQNLQISMSKDEGLIRHCLVSDLTLFYVSISLKKTVIKFKVHLLSIFELETKIPANNRQTLSV